MAAGPDYSKASVLIAQLASKLTERKYSKPGELDASASRLAEFCPRETALAAKHGVVRERTIFSDMKYIFTVGQAVHDAFQNYLLGPLGLLLGVWRCHHCAKRHGEYPARKVPMPRKCTRCGTFRTEERGYNFSYIEDELVDTACGFVSHPDGYDPDGLIWEFKSIGGSYQGKPKLEHIIQVQANMHVQRLVRGVKPRYARLVYIEKASLGVLDGVHEFHVPYNQRFAEGHYARAIELAQFFIDGTLPQRVCDSPTCTRADRCSVRAFCF